MGYGDAERVEWNGNIGKIRFTENVIVFFILFFMINVFFVD